SNFHGKVEEGQKFAGWTLDGETVYAPGSEFTFTKDLAADLGTNEDGVHGYLFSFKASFVDAEAPETEAPQTEAPQTEAPQTEAPQTEAPQTEAPQTEAPQTEAPQTEAPQTEAPQTEAPQTEEETETETDEEVKPAPGDDGKDENGKGDDSAKKADQTEAVKTGDNTMIMPYVISLLAAAAVFAVILLKRRKSVR
ncbi:LPXTG cell wall anchor domain-containing protein, partial [Parablautia sp. Marseille-Q6255]|uniref:LPXTG cell wall anchor domain-containing protein n=1 Tax=Parablautia sp. Marseille-Q6255 TaxID=3039593 RepID=UPI0024BCC01E